MSTGPWTTSKVGGGLAVVFDPYMPDGKYLFLRKSGTLMVRDKANLEQLCASLNRVCKIAGYGPTRAMLGNSRRRDLLAQIRARTRRYWEDEFTHVTDKELEAEFPDIFARILGEQT